MTINSFLYFVSFQEKFFHLSPPSHPTSLLWNLSSLMTFGISDNESSNLYFKYIQYNAFNILFTCHSVVSIFHDIKYFELEHFIDWKYQNVFTISLFLGSYFPLRKYFLRKMLKNETSISRVCTLYWKHSNWGWWPLIEGESDWHSSDRHILGSSKMSGKWITVFGNLSNSKCLDMWASKVKNTVKCLLTEASW